MLISKKDRFGAYAQYFNKVIRNTYVHTMQFHKFELTDEEIEEIFIKPEHRETLRLAAELTWQQGRVNASGTFQGIEFVAARQYLNAPYLIPKYAMNAGLVIIPENRVDEFLRAKDDNNRWYNEFSLLFQLISWMDSCRELTSWGQIRYFFPGIVTLVDMSDIPENDKLRKFLAKPLSSASMPSMPVSFRNACRQATQTLARAKLLHRTLAPENKDGNWSVFFCQTQEKSPLYPDGVPSWISRVKVEFG